MVVPFRKLGHQLSLKFKQLRTGFFKSDSKTEIFLLVTGSEKYATFSKMELALQKRLGEPFESKKAIILSMSIKLFVFKALELSLALPFLAIWILASTAKTTQVYCFNNILLGLNRSFFKYSFLISLDKLFFIVLLIIQQVIKVISRSMSVMQAGKTIFDSSIHITIYVIDKVNSSIELVIRFLEKSQKATSPSFQKLVSYFFIWKFWDFLQIKHHSPFNCFVVLGCGDPIVHQFDVVKKG